MQEEGAGNKRSILVPISDTASSQEALARIVPLARSAGNHLLLLHAVQLNIVGEERGIKRGKLLGQLMVEAESRLTEWAHSICKGVPFTVVITEGPLVKAVAQVKSTVEEELIVMDTHQSRSLQGWWRDHFRAGLRTAGPALHSRPV
jgi:hypothetical protein